MRRLPSVACGLLVAALALGCGHAKPPVEPEEPATVDATPPRPPPPPAPPSLYERLGKRDALDGIVEELLGNVLADKRISKMFDKVRKDKDRAKQLRARLVGELCAVAGGGADDCAYDGQPMKDAHKGLGIGAGQWDAFIEDLGIALKTRNVDDALAKELIGKLEEQTKADIVTTPTKGK